MLPSGFWPSGFGFSALLVASWSLVTDPAKAVALALIMEVTASVFQAFSVWKDIPWRRVGLLIAGAIVYPANPLWSKVLMGASVVPLAWTALYTSGRHRH